MLERGRDECHIVIDEGLTICFQSFDKVSVGRGRGRVKRRGEENKREEKRREREGGERRERGKILPILPGQGTCRNL